MKTILDQSIRTRNPIINNGGFPAILPHTLTIDRLELTFDPVNELVPLHENLSRLPATAGFISASGDIQLKLTTKSIKGFSHCKYTYYLYYKRERVAVVGTEFHQKSRGRDFTKLKFENFVFYTKPRSFWLEVFYSFTAALPLQFRNVCYIEIALDANREFRDHLGHLYHYSKKAHYCLPEHQVYCPRSGSIIGTFHDEKTILIGRKEAKQIAVYDKK